MDAFEISLAQKYLAASGQDPVAALIRSVRDLAMTQRLVSFGFARGSLPASGLIPDRRSSLRAETPAPCAEACEG